MLLPPPLALPPTPHWRHTTRTHARPPPTPLPPLPPTPQLHPPPQPMHPTPPPPPPTHPPPHPLPTPRPLRPHHSHLPRPTHPTCPLLRHPLPNLRHPLLHPQEVLRQLSPPHQARVLTHLLLLLLLLRAGPVALQLHVVPAHGEEGGAFIQCMRLVSGRAISDKDAEEREGEEARVGPARYSTGCCRLVSCRQPACSILPAP